MYIYFVCTTILIVVVTGVLSLNTLCTTALATGTDVRVIRVILSLPGAFACSSFPGSGYVCFQYGTAVTSVSR